MTEPPQHEPPPPPSLHDVDERWTVPWALLEEEAAAAPAEATLVWHGASPAFGHAGYTVPRPMLYASEGRSVDAEASCINTALPVGEADFDMAPPVPHWATYASLTPQQRANYLRWLASDRTMPLRDINYAFLYFYGLERHALIDRGDPEEVLRILMRLLKHYDDAPSFFSSASRLAAFLFATKGIEKLKPAWFDRLFVKRAVPLHADSVSVALTWLYERKKPLPATLAFEIARQDLRCPHGDAFRSDPAAFEAQFAAGYTERFGDGMKLQRAEKNQTWKYRPINPALQSWEHFAGLWSVTSADIAAEQSQFSPLVELWRECDVAAEASPWVALVDAHISPGGRVLVPVRTLAGQAGVSFASGRALGLAESLVITEAADDAGFDLLPNPRLLLRPYKWTERVALVRRPETPHLAGEPYYLAGGLLLALGTAMAEVDGEVDHIEVLHVSEIVNSLYHFNDYDKHRLGVLRKRLLKFPPKLASLTRRVRAVLSEEELSSIGKFLVGVAGANFHIGDEEQRALRRAYRAFNLSAESLDSLLATLVLESDTDGTRRVDEAVLARLMRETKDFAARLGTAMQALVPVVEEGGKRGVWYTRTTPEAADAATPDGRDPYNDALYEMLQRPDWTEADFIALGEKHGVFAEGAVRTSEAWVTEIAGEGAARWRLAAETEEEEHLSENRLP